MLPSPPRFRRSSRAAVAAALVVAVAAATLASPAAPGATAAPVPAATSAPRAAAPVVELPAGPPDGADGDGDGDGPTVRVLDVALGSDGSATVVADSRVPASSAPSATAGEDEQVVSVDIALASGEVLRRDVAVADVVRAELPLEPGSTRLEPTRVTDPTPVVHVVVPDGARPTGLTVRTDQGTFRAADPRPVGRPVGRAPVRIAVPGYTFGPRSNRLDIVVLGDGYTAAQRDQFAADAKRLADDVFAVQPYAAYRSFVNVVALFAPSAQSGADQPAYRAGCTDQRPAPGCCPESSAAAQTGKRVRTRYDSTFCAFGIQRLLVPIDDRAIARDAAAYPGADQVLVVVNDPSYGGAGGAVASVSTNPAASSILPHEIGHSLLGLDDEYTTPTPGYPPCSDRRRNGVRMRCDANITDVSDRSRIKWRRWISADTPVPTSGPVSPEDRIGLFLGGHYSADTYYRPCDDCLMRSLDRPMGAVGSEQLPLRLFGPRRFDVDLIDGASPGNGATVLVGTGEVQSFTVDVLSTAPAAGTQLTWTVDGAVVSSGLVATGPTTLTLNGDGAAHTVKVTAGEAVGALHPSDRGLSRTTRTWRVRPRAQVVANPGFERKLGTTWRGNARKARVCSDRARTKRCSARLVASPKRAVVLAQALRLASVDAGDRLVLKGFANSAANKPTTATLRLVGTDGSRSTLVLKWSADRRDRKRYVARSRSLTLPTGVRSATLTLKLPRGRGATNLDDLSVLVTAAPG